MSDRFFRHVVLKFAMPFASFLKTSPKPTRNGRRKSRGFFLMIFGVSPLSFLSFHRKVKVAKKQFWTPFLDSKHQKRIKVSQNEAFQKVGRPNREL